MEEQGEGLARPAALVQGVDQIVPGCQEHPRVGLGIDQVEGLPQQLHLPFSIAALAVDHGLLEERAPEEVPLAEPLVESADAVEQLEGFGESLLILQQRRLETEYLRPVEG